MPHIWVMLKQIFYFFFSHSIDFVVKFDMSICMCNACAVDLKQRTKSACVLTKALLVLSSNNQQAVDKNTEVCE